MIAFEKHYRVKELAGLWGVSAKTIRRMFASEPGVIRIANHGTGKRKWVLLSIPESVVVRIHETLSAKPIQTTLAGGHPLRVIRLRDLHDGKSRHPRNIIKLKAAPKDSDIAWDHPNMSTEAYIRGRAVVRDGKNFKYVSRKG